MNQNKHQRESYSRNYFTVQFQLRFFRLHKIWLQFTILIRLKKMFIYDSY